MSKGKADDADGAIGSEEPPAWVSQRAVAWALDDAPCPVELLPALIAVARRCDENGRGSRQSVPTIAAKIGKSPKQTQRDLARLRELGLLVPGDPALVEHMPAGQRPAVYDVPLHVKGPKPMRESRNPAGGRKTPPTDGGTPMEGAPPTHGGTPIQGATTHPMDGGTTPPIHGVGTPPMDGVQNNPLNNPLEQPSLSAREATPTRPVAAAPTRERDEPDSRPTLDLPHRLLAAQGIVGTEADRIIDAVTIRNAVRGDGWWRSVDRNGDLPALIAKTRATLHNGVGAWPATGGGMSTAEQRAGQALQVADDLDRRYGQGGLCRDPSDGGVYDAWPPRLPPDGPHRGLLDGRPQIVAATASIDTAGGPTVVDLDPFPFSRLENPYD